MPGECWNCGQWLSGGDLLEGRCWNCKRAVRVSDGGHPGVADVADNEVTDDECSL